MIGPPLARLALHASATCNLLSLSLLPRLHLVMQACLNVLSAWELCTVVFTHGLAFAGTTVDCCGCWILCIGCRCSVCCTRSCGNNARRDACRCLLVHFVDNTIVFCALLRRGSRRHRLERERRGCNGRVGALADGCGGGSAAVRQPAVPLLLSRVLSTILSMFFTLGVQCLYIWPQVRCYHHYQQRLQFGRRTFKFVWAAHKTEEAVHLCLACLPASCHLFPDLAQHIHQLVSIGHLSCIFCHSAVWIQFLRVHSGSAACLCVPQLCNLPACATSSAKASPGQ